MNTYLCCDDRRRDAVRAQLTIKGIDFNGLDYLEVLDSTTLLLHFIHPLKPGALGKENVRIAGGERIRNVAVVNATRQEGESVEKREAAKDTGEEGDHHSNVLKVTVNQPGDYSTYTLSLAADPRRLVLDPLLSTIDFTFQLPTNTIDCQQEELCVPEAQVIPDIDYMAKDYTSFRQLMLDRMSATMPQWTERSPADMGVMLVELLAYVADYLSYQQDAIATESYLSTARLRISARRHARLLDYVVNDGCTARAWVQVQVCQDVVAGTGVPSVLPKGTRFLTQVMGLDQTMQAQPTVFEPITNVTALYKAHNTLSFYTWGARECCLPKGSTSATLLGAWQNLEPGDVLVFKELVDPHTGQAMDAEPTHRHAVRLTSVLTGSDPLGTWPNDHSGQQDDPAGLGRVIAEYRIVEDDRLRVEEAGLISTREGHRVEKQEEHIEEDTQTVVQRYVIEKPDKTTITVEVRIRRNDHHIEVHVLESGHAVQGEQRLEEIEEAEEQNTEDITETVQEQERPQQADNAEPEDVDSEEVNRQPTQKRLPPLDTTGIDIVDIDTIELSSLEKSAAERAELEGSETQKEAFTEEERETTKGGEEEEKIREKRTRVVHTYRIIREPDYSQPITRIEWGYEDALPFSLCISATTDYDHGNQYIEGVSVALGNIVLADCGMTEEEDGQQQDHILIPNVVPESTMNWAVSSSQHCAEQQVDPVPPRFYPRLKYSPLTFVIPGEADDSTLSATALMSFDARDAIPSITLRSSDTDVFATNSPTWNSQPDLLSSGPTDLHFVVEIEADGTTYLRFGDDQHGLRPDPGTHFIVTYRVGNGVAGNIGRDALCHIVTNDATLLAAVKAITNPMPASGGCEPDSVEQIRQHSAGSLTEQARGVTPQDYITLATQDPQVHRANALLRWTGSWYTVFLVVERENGLPVDDAFEQSLRQRLEQYRMAGTDLVIVSPVYVPLEISMTAYYKQGYLPGDVETALLKVFSNQQWPDGERGFFYPDNFGFGQPVYLNELYVAARAVPGIERVDITTFQRQDIPGTGLKDGVLPMDWLEIAMLENNPRYPERGLFRLMLTESEAQYVRS
jgi:hypothetical protein